MSPAFVQAAAKDPLGGLATMFLAAFGVTLATLMSVADKVLAKKDANLIIMSFAAGVQIRANVVWVTREFGSIKTLYPELIIEGTRGVRDIFNFGALHALGHLLGHVSNHGNAKNMLAKAGSCITGTGVTDSEAGSINKEIAASWTADDRAAFNVWVADRKMTMGDNLDKVVGSISALAQNFSKVVGANPAGRTGAAVEEVDDEDPEA